MTTTFSPNGNGHAIPAYIAMPDLPQDDMEDRDNTAALRRKGLIRVHGIIPIKLNERIKLMARQMDTTSDKVIGEMILKSAADVDRWEAEQEVSRLRERFGDEWMDVLRKAQGSTGQ